MDSVAILEAEPVTHNVPALPAREAGRLQL